jgi:hypothetical protein
MVITYRCSPYNRGMVPRKQRWLLVVVLVLSASFVVAFVTQCSGGRAPLGGRTRIVEQFDNGPLRPGPDGKLRMNSPGASEGYFRVAEDANPTPGKQWRTINPDDLSPEERKRLP